MERNRWLVLAVVALSFLPVTIDSTVLYLAIPALTRDLGASGIEILWIMDIYSLTMAGLVLVSGPLGDRFGQRNLLLLGLFLFALASGAAAFAPSPAVLIGCRVALALGGCMIIPSTLAIVRRIFTDPRERGIAIGLWGAVASAGSALGPVVGGLLLEHFWWGSVFLVNVPVSLGTLLVTAVLVRSDLRGARGPLQPVTALAGILGLVGAVYALKSAARGEGDPFLIAGIGGVGLLLLGLFAWRQWTAPVPMLDLRLFRLRRFSIGVFTACVPILVLIGFILALVQYLQFVAGLSPLRAGLVIVPLDIAGAFAGPLVGYVLARRGMRGLAAGALAIACAGYGLMLGFGVAGPGVPLAIAVMAIIGIGHGALMSIGSSTVMSAAPAEKAGAAASIESVAFEVGTGMGIAVFGSVLGLAYAGAFTGPAEYGASIGATLSAAETLGGEAGAALAAAGREAFGQAFRLVVVASIAALALSALLILRFGPARENAPATQAALGKSGA